MTEARTPHTKAARQARIGEVLRGAEVRSQQELADLLAAEGFAVTQGTLSRDLVDVGAVRVRDAAGELVYALRGEVPQGRGQRLARLGQAACLNRCGVWLSSPQLQLPYRSGYEYRPVCV